MVSRARALDRILVGVDFRQPSLAAARWAVAQFGAGAAVELLHVLPVPDVPSFLRPLMPALDDRMTTMSSSPLEGLRGFAETLSAGRVSAQVRVGLRVERLAERARSSRADLVVLGRETVNGRRGRTLERLVRRLAVPALVVGGRAGERPRRILAAIDGGTTGSAVVQWAADLAHRFDAELTLLHVLSDTLLAQDWLPHGAGERVTHAWLRGQLRHVGGPELVGDTSVATGAPGPLILDQARALEADLVVMGLNGADAAGPTEIGAATRLLLRASPVPVFLVPHAGVGQSGSARRDFGAASARRVRATGRGPMDDRS